MASSDEDDEDMKAAIALSLAECDASGSARPTSTASSTQGGDPAVRASTPSGMLHLGLDRKSMEAQRLARLKRKSERSISPPEARKAPKLTEETITLSSGARLNMISTIVKRDQSMRKPMTANAAIERMQKKPSVGTARIKVEDDDTKLIDLTDSQNTLKYPTGTVKKTWAFGHDRTGNEVKLEEVLEPLTLKTAVLSAFQWDTNWLLSKLKIPPNGGSTKCIFVMQAKELAQKQEMLETAQEMRSFLRLCFPPMDGQVNCMHSKLMLLFHAEKLRVAIPTANLLNFDWGETGVMENSVFMIDLPRLPNDSKTKPVDLPPFGKELLFFLEKQGLDADVRAGVLNFDFRATANMAFVHTIGGTSFDDAAHRTGLPGLSTAVRTLNLHTDTLELDFAASSIGSLNNAFLSAVHVAAQGEDLIASARLPAQQARSTFFSPAAAATTAARQTPSRRPAAVRETFRIYFPTRETVAASTAGAAGSICLSRNWFEAETFPRACFRDHRSTRPGLLSHNKILCARGKRRNPGTGQQENVAWLYVGSANVSESAWGKVSVNKKKGDVRVNCRNWECGVLLPVLGHAVDATAKGIKTEETAKVNIKDEDVEKEDSETESEEDGDGPADGGDEELTGELVSMDVFKDVIDLPFHVPGERYGGREPWYFKESV